MSDGLAFHSHPVDEKTATMNGEAGVTVTHEDLRAG
jgi:hypothetical protein